MRAWFYLRQLLARVLAMLLAPEPAAGSSEGLGAILRALGTVLRALAAVFRAVALVVRAFTPLVDALRRLIIALTRGRRPIMIVKILIYLGMLTWPVVFAVAVFAPGENSGLRDVVIAFSVWAAGVLAGYLVNLWSLPFLESLSGQEVVEGRQREEPRRRNDGD